MSTVDYKACAESLFMLLDDIDTANDMAKSDDKSFRGIVNGLHKRRFDIASTDGRSIVFK